MGDDIKLNLQSYNYFIIGLVPEHELVPFNYYLVFLTNMIRLKF